MEQNDNVKETLGDRMKKYESLTQIKLENDKPYIIRLDGHSFSKFTKSLQQPWDLRFMLAMTLTTYDLITTFGATTGYTQSDEITLTFFPAIVESTNTFAVLPFNGKVQKLVSLTAGYASTRFNFHLAKLFNDQTYFEEMRSLDQEKPIKSIDKVNNCIAHFDSRCFQLPTTEEVFNCILWRTRDAYKNVISKTAQHLFGVKPCFKKNTTEKVAMINDKDSSYLSSLHPYISHGVFVKKELYIPEGMDTTRSRMTCLSASHISPDQLQDWCTFISNKTVNK